MSITAGTISLVSVGSTTASLSATAATAGTPPYTQQWYRSTTSGFSPGVGNLISGATGLTLSDSGLIPNTSYYYKVVYTDSTSATATATQLLVSTTAPVLNPNQFAQFPFLGAVDLNFNYDTVAVQIAATQMTGLYAGAAVKISPQSVANSVPQVIGCAADSDNVLGFINFDIKSIQFGGSTFNASQFAQVSTGGNVIYLYATGAITQGTQVTLDLTSQGGVAQATGSSGNTIVGWAYDGAAAAGALIRVKLITPSFLLD